MRKILSSLILASSSLLISISVSALPVDEHGRTLLEHEAQGGHTIKRHVAKSLSWLRNRCRTDRAVKRSYATSYSDRADAEDIISDMIKDNRGKVNAFIKYSRSTSVIHANESLFERPFGYGNGINCRKVGKTKKISFVFRGRPFPFNIPLDVVPRTKAARTVLKKSSRATGGWHILTSYPTKN
jgi:hypothetical protein